MGRKPNPLILEYFVRGPKLNDNSNRYPHTCKQCGENFPKGRIDSLTTHITKKCPAISESDRMRACLELHGITNARAPVDRPPPEAQPNGQPVDVPNLPQGWSALETLAEASRQVDLNENNRAQSVQAGVVDPADPANTQHVPDRFELHEQFTLDNPPVSYENRSQQGNRGAIQQPLPGTELSPEERLQALLPNSVASPDASNISVAVAATARLNPSLLDPQLVHETGTSTTPPSMDIPTPIEASPSAVTAPDSGISQPWGEMTYLATASPVPLLHEHPPTPIQMSRGGVRMDTSDGQLNGRPRHARSRFTAARRKEVQEEQLDLYSAGVQVVLSQNRINLLKNQLNMTHDGTMIEVSHFPETGKVILLEALVALLEPSESLAESRGSKDSFFQVIMIDQDKEDVPGKVEAYMRDVFQLFIDREPSKFMRVTLSLALQQLQESEDDLLRKSLELWGLVESIDRERQWNVIERPANKNEEPRRIQEAKSENDADIYTTLCMQLNAAAERKANNTSKALLSGMHRVLQDSKVKVNFKMYLTAIIFLNCLEKSTWAFKAWEQDHLRPGWPLERDPGVFTQQGGNLAGLLKMLLAIRKALPQTLRSEAGKLITSEQDPVIGTYFQSIDLDYDTILARQDGSPFSPADSRSLEMILCSHLLITNTP
ncbi:hypothetical protein Forpi1262_v006200 [Fusarium oxysporum f. sp. raphani]|uniref:Uncharacterized protein n=2 Tax=Fusarium oxysporum TaxID=5507 RepID=N4URD6_FUSC1|nr:hypothetical protein FOC1_g10011192 [Fusarium oxysporum f. sp. cubense race 1]KAG7432774.1 hypothetical protein Forpi1262_v006200 [Fusarium oxysporum f. sp. raphani]